MGDEPREIINHSCRNYHGDSSSVDNGDPGRAESMDSIDPPTASFSKVGLTLGILGGLLVWAIMAGIVYLVYQKLAS